MGEEEAGWKQEEGEGEVGWKQEEGEGEVAEVWGRSPLRHYCRPRSGMTGHILHHRSKPACIRGSILHVFERASNMS